MKLLNELQIEFVNGGDRWGDEPSYTRPPEEPPLDPLYFFGFGGSVARILWNMVR